MTARRMRNLPGSRTCSNAALLSSTQLPETLATRTVMAWLLSRFVTLRRVPIGNVPLDAAGSPPSPDSVTVEPLQTTSPAAPPPPLFAGGGAAWVGGFVAWAGGLVAWAGGLAGA